MASGAGGTEGLPAGSMRRNAGAERRERNDRPKPDVQVGRGGLPPKLHVAIAPDSGHEVGQRRWHSLTHCCFVHCKTVYISTLALGNAARFFRWLSFKPDATAKVAGHHRLR